MKNRKIPQLKITIRNESEDVAVIDIDGTIGFDLMKFFEGEKQENTKEAIKGKLKEISELGASKIIVNISSFGGFVDDGLAIHDALSQHKAEIETRVTGMTASAATIIAQAGDVRKMSDNALYLIHQAWGMAFGNTNDVETVLDDLRQIDKRIVNIYAKRSGKSEQEFVNLMAENNGNGRWIDTEEALEFGLIDEAYEPMKVAASVDVNTLKNSGLPIPTQLLDGGSDGKFDGRLTNDQIFDWMKSDDRVKDYLKEQFNEFSKESQFTIKGEDLAVALNKEHDSSESEAIPEGISLEEARNREIELLTNEA